MQESISERRYTNNEALVKERVWKDLSSCNKICHKICHRNLEMLYLRGF